MTCGIDESLLVMLQPEAVKRRTYWETFFVAFPLYCAYATLFGFQHQVKHRLGIEDDSSDSSVIFGFIVSLQYVFNLIFRIMHGVLFASMNSRQRVFAAMVCMIGSMLLLAGPIMTYGCGLTTMCLAYVLGGVAVGTFEPNFLASIACLGGETKRIAILGIPVGISSILIGGFFCIGPPLDIPAHAVYAFAAAGLLLGMIVLASVPYLPEAQEATGWERLRSDAKEFRRWLPRLWSFSLVFLLDMLTIASSSPGVWLYIYDQDTVTVMSGKSEITIATDTFFAIFNCFNMLGSIAGRWLSYLTERRHPVVYSVFSAIGIVLMLMRLPLLLPLSTFFVMLGDGMIYGTVARHIDENIPKEFNLISTSYWCLNGDIGAIVGTNLITFLRALWAGR
eukprot:TRINITY_DN61179_c0_g1_i1.p1 TRINITY_DN61179_c0_g1~~TRINITY_DN61179_c0_g1_i1.p1  ORF type:complete len:393 (+),score=51.60 TRINITY_DN61179_c0_g1_i1:61-1239(+)